MRPNKIREIWKQGGAVANGWLATPAAFSAEVMAHCGWDSVTVDMQHGLIDYQVAVSQFQAISTTDVVPMVRVPWLDAGLIMKVLDAGAYGVICPMINNGNDARMFAHYASYPPLGTRSFGPVRASIYGGADYTDKANDEIIRMAMVETKEGLEKVDEIVNTDGIDAIYVGPNDLANALGQRPTLDTENEVVLRAFETIIKACRSAGKPVGLHNGSAAYAVRMIKMGFQLVTVQSDAGILKNAASSIVAEIKGGVAKLDTSSY
ncbi:MAG: 2,4-dihydroxyhept-2-ene-1,7-dioic acid aldolase [Alphaproteobacteria bacterium TMED89]|nr:2,4-dihydroxyhept-2-ene-1,7-dioic acid aldolase [Rhodospirillaceae bacterium]RPH12127.1 MAG: 2,4-dihydroxyhept-2-ene-1,7-dioic acid aldolase [Alphaproteobacteria bacterium TMED89]